MSDSREFKTYYIIPRVSFRVMLSFQQQSENDASNSSNDGKATRNVREGVLVVGDTGDVQEGNGGSENNGRLRNFKKVLRKAESEIQLGKICLPKV